MKGQLWKLVVEEKRGENVSWWNEKLWRIDGYLYLWRKSAWSV